MNLKNYENRYLKPDDFLEPTKCIITKVQEEVVNRKRNTTRPVIYFEGYDRGIILAKLKQDMLIFLMGSSDTDEWTGRSVVVYTTWTKYEGKPVKGIRFRQR